MLKLLAALGLTLSLLLTACGGDDDDGSSSPGDGSGNGPSDRDDGGDGGQGSEFQACSLLTADEVGAVVEEEIKEGREQGATVEGATACAWESADGPTVVFVELLLEDGENWYDAIHQGTAEGQLQPVEGLGDVAVWDAFLGTIEVVDDDRFISVQPVIVLSEVNNRAAAIELARIAVERMP